VFVEPASPLVWITADVALTEDAIARYRLGADASQAHPELKRLFERLLADEEDHRGRLIELVDYWREKPEPEAPLEQHHIAPHSEDGRIHGFLDFAIKHEYAVILQYLHHSFLLKDQRVSRDMEEIAIEEMRHLGWLSEKLVERKGCPFWEADRLELTEDPIEMLELDLAREIEVEADYQEITAAMADPEIRALFDRIGDHETYHAGVIAEMIDRLKSAQAADKLPVRPSTSTVGSLLGTPQA
jgi:bacterioferritin